MSAGESRARIYVAALCLAVLAAAEARNLSPGDAARRLALAARQISGCAIEPTERMGFFFDPDYAAFLDEVSRRTPPGATVAVIVPERPDVYRFQAVYQLAPRRVVDEPLTADADWIAVWGPRRAELVGGLPIGRAGALAPNRRRP